jgi:putative Mg2+ transporter-C (MgtC) family protein
VRLTLDLLHYTGNVFAAMIMGLVLGLERQYRGHPAGLRTNALVCVGAAMFVSLTRLFEDTNSPTRIASYIVSGIGFLGGGVIIREGMTVRGMNTAATLWCAAAVGTLTGAGFAAYALVGMLAILAVNVGLRPLAHWLDESRKMAPGVECLYRMRVLCVEREQAVIRTIVMRHVNGRPKMVVQGIATRETDQHERVAIEVDIFAIERNDRAMEELVERLNIEPGVAAVSWEKAG